MDVQKIIELGAQAIQKASDDGNHDAVSEMIRSFQKKPGVQTTEFWLSVVASIFGGILQAWPGHEAVGGALIGVSVLSYALSRGIYKASR